MKISELLKEYRIKQGKTQKEWSGNVLSTSFYTKVEKNRCRIYAQDLIDLLRENNISLVDFFSKLNKHDQSIQKQELKINSIINSAYYQNSQKDLYTIRNLVLDSKLPDKDEKLLLIDTCLVLNEKDNSKIEPKTIDKLKAKIFNIANFDKDSVMLYCNSMAFYDLSSNLIISKRIIRQFVKSNHPLIQQEVLAIISNILIICIHEQKFNETKLYVEYSKQIKIKPDTFFYKTLVLALQNIIKYYSQNQQKYLLKANEIFDCISISGMPHYVKDIQRELKNAKI